MPGNYASGEYFSEAIARRLAHATSRRMVETSRLAMSFHEAGHATVARAHGTQVAIVRIAPMCVSAMSNSVRRGRLRSRTELWRTRSPSSGNMVRGEPSVLDQYGS